MRTIGWLFSQRSVKLSVTIVLVTALVLLQPSQMWAQVPTPSVIPALVNCRLSTTQPLNAIDMNTVSLRTQVKTVHVEKEFFNCIAIPTQQTVIAMVSIYTEIFENLSANTTTKTNTVETCVKQLNGTVLGCQMTIPNTTTFPPITSCTNQPLAFPVRMNTVVATGPSTNPNVAETVEAEKEVFSCNSITGNPTTIEDVVIFTKILEDMNTGKTLSTKFVVATCAKNIATLAVACK